MAHRFLLGAQLRDPALAIDTHQACVAAFGDAGSVRIGSIDEEDPLYRVFDRDEVIDSAHARSLPAWRAMGPSLAEVITSASSQKIH